MTEYRQHKGNFAFIDGINLHLTYEYIDWKIDYKKLHQYLAKRHNVTKAYFFLGFIERNKRIYKNLKSYGYEVKFRDVSEYPTNQVTCPDCNGMIKPEGVSTKCDCDADITLQIMIDIEKYQKAILITGDGDFDNVVKKLMQVNKLKLILAPCKNRCSRLLKKASRGRIEFLDNLRNEIEKL